MVNLNSQLVRGHQQNCKLRQYFVPLYSRYYFTYFPSFPWENWLKTRCNVYILALSDIQNLSESLPNNQTALGSIWREIHWSRWPGHWALADQFLRLTTFWSPEFPLGKRDFHGFFCPIEAQVLSHRCHHVILWSGHIVCCCIKPFNKNIFRSLPWHSTCSSIDINLHRQMLLIS